MTDPRRSISARIQALVEQYFALGEVPGARGTARIPLHVPSYGAAEVNEALASLLSTRVGGGEKVGPLGGLWPRCVGAAHAFMVTWGSSATPVAAEVHDGVVRA